MTAMLLVSAAASSAASTPASPPATPAGTGDAAPFAAVLDAVADGSSPAPDAGTTADDDVRPGPARGRSKPAGTGDDTSGTDRPTAAVPTPVPAALPAAVPMPVTAAIVTPVPAAAASATPPPSAPPSAPPNASPSARPTTRSASAGAENPIVAPAGRGPEKSGLLDCYRIHEQTRGAANKAPVLSGFAEIVAGAARVEGAGAARVEGSGAGPAADAAAGTAAAAQAALPAAPPAVAPAPAPAVPAAAPVVVEAVQPALTSALAHLRRGPDGVHELEVTLHPADLGTVQIRVTLHQGAMDVTVACAHAAARDAVTAALPALHRELAGLSTVDVGMPRHPHAGGESRVDADAGARDGRRPDTGEQQAERDRRRPPSTSDSFDRWM